MLTPQVYMVFAIYESAPFYKFIHVKFPQNIARGEVWSKVKGQSTLKSREVSYTEIQWKYSC